MQLNFFIGLKGTHDALRELFENDSRINTPILPLYRVSKGKVIKAAIEKTGSIDSINNIVFNTTNLPRSNIGIPAVRDNGPATSLFLPVASPGTKFWLFKHNDQEESKRLHKIFLTKFAGDDYLARFNLKKPTMTVEELDNVCNQQLEMLDRLADKFQASPWTTFNLKDYYEDDIDLPTSLLVRLYTKD